MAIELTEWDSAKYLRTKEDIALYLEACFDEAGDDPAFIADMLANITRSAGMAQLAQETDIDRDSLTAALLNENGPSLAAMLTLLKSLGLVFRVKPVQSCNAKQVSTG
ncbi:addiction module antidote protein [Pseudoduganella namucuonensis]|uniref:Probable addiction module antidote protein n=1 Tax=Pseudoduganella namucuonensis TaxID=1035707 RepID=A0A1I7M0C0_9BURK|nr:addiction module antidote protein [Pseudoduganella namucuonensis]SFV15412.1 probable addiction module antidote protein [Pseudoduganella namucuonensis]